jgi:hypothetical protein
VAGGGGLITSVTSPLSVTSGDLSVDLSAYLPLTGGNITAGSSYTNLAPALVGVAAVTLPDFAYLEPNSIKAEHAETDGYGLQSYLTTVTAQQTNFAYAGNGPYGGQTGATSLTYSNLSFGYNVAGITGSANFNPNGASATVVNAIGSVTTTWSLSGSGLAWNNGTVYGEFNASGVRFPDGTTQNTAASAGIPDAPSDGSYYARLNASWAGFTPGFADATADGQLYARQNNTWFPFALGISDAPSDGSTYGRNNNAWVVAGGGSPPYTNAVWAYGNWYSANVTGIYDGYMNYYTVLTF